MENAIIINQSEDLKFWSKEYTRIYFGNEFCPRLFPGKDEISVLLKFIKDKKLKLTLLTSWLDSLSLESSKEMVGFVMSKKILTEVVVNGYGFLYYLNRKYPSLKIVMGRAITWLTPELSINNFFSKMGVERIEYDNLETMPKNQTIGKISYYYPYSMLAASRYCPVAGIFENKSENYGIRRCFKECLRVGELRVKSAVSSKSILLRGNTLFLENKVDLKVLDGKYIDRLVFQPRLPL